MTFEQAIENIYGFTDDFTNSFEQQFDLYYPELQR